MTDSQEPSPQPPTAPSADPDVFLSYAHSDDINGIVSTLHGQLEGDLAPLLGRHVEIFLDRSDILDFHDWKVRCHRALRASSFFIVLLSPAYLRSDACRWEWEEWLKRELEHGQVGSGAACLWFVEIASLDAPDDAARLRKWKNELRQRFGVTFHAWREGGREALRDAAARAELSRLTEHVAQRLRLLALDRSQRGNLGWPQDRFVGRENELRLLRSRLLGDAPAAPVALVGIGGIGKTALALTFAFREAAAFPGGCWLIRCEGRASFAAALASLVRDLDITLTEHEKTDDTLAARRVLATLRPRGTTLLLLDNVDIPALLAPAELSLLGGETTLCLLLTTRLAPAAFTDAGAAIIPIDIDHLPEDQALELIRLHQPDAAFASLANETAAREIVRALGGLTLAIETAAVYLGQNDSRVEPRYAVPIADYLERLRLDLASSGEAEPGARPGDVIRQLREVAATIRPTLLRLDAPARTVLQLAALLPPDSLPLPWLRHLAGQVHPALTTDAAVAERDPWTDLVRALIGMRLLHPSNDPRVLTIHRLLQRVLETELREDREALAAALDSHLAARAQSIIDTQAPPADWELDALLLSMPARLALNPARSLADPALFLTEKITTRRTLPAAAAFLSPVHQTLSTLAAASLENLDTQRDLSVSLERLGHLAAACGDLRAAGRHFTARHVIAERLATADPANAQWQRDLSFSLNKLGDHATACGDLPAAERYFAASLAIRERLATADPANAQWQRDLAVSRERLGDIATACGDLPAAELHFTASLAFAERLVAADPTNAQWQHNLWVSLSKLGDHATARGDLPTAERHFSASLAIAEHLAAVDPDNAQWQFDLGISYEHLGNLAVAQGKLDEALVLQARRNDIINALATADPANAQWQRDLAASCGNLGDLATARGDLPVAERHFTTSLAIRERLAAADPDNAQWQRDIAVSLERLGDLATTQGNLSAAELHFTTSLATRERLVTADPANAQWQRGLSVSLEKLGELATARGDLPAAARHFTACNAIVARLAAADPANAQWQRDLSASLGNLGSLAMAQGDLAAALRHCTACNAIFEQLASTDLTNVTWQNEVRMSRVLLAEVRARLARTSGFLPEVADPSAVATAPPAPPRDPAPAALALLKAGKAREALDMLRPSLFPGETVDMDHRKPLLARLVFLHALWMTENVDGVIRHQSYIPEQDDPRVRAIGRTLAEWRQGFSLAHKLGLRAKPPLPPLSPLDDETL